MLIPGTLNLIIDEDYKVQTTEDNHSLFEELPDGRYRIEIYGQTLTQSGQWIYLFSHFEVRFPKGVKVDLNDIEFKPAPKYPTKPSKGFVMTFKNPVLTKVLGRLVRIVPGYTHLGVSTDSRIYDLRTSEEVNQVYKPNNYPSITTYDPDRNKVRRLYSHRLIALAYIDNCSFILNPLVNHIDGSRDNNAISNLEWTSSTGNNRHAIFTDSRPDVTKVLIRDITTGEITQYPSLSEAERTLGFKEGALRSRVRASTLINERYEYRLDGDTRPWFYVNEGLKVNVRNRYIINLYFKNGKHETWYEAQELRKHYMLSFRMHETRSLKNIKRKLKEKFPGLVIKVKDLYPPRATQARCATTGKVFEGKTMTGLAKIIGLDKGVVSKGLKDPDCRVRAGYQFRYKTEEPWVDVKEVYTIERGCVSSSVNEGVKEFPSLRSAARYYNVDKKSILTRLDCDRLIHKDGKLKGISFKSIVTGHPIE